MEKIEGKLYRYTWGDEVNLGFFDDTGIDFCWDDFRKLCPALTKGLRKGQTRKVVLTQTPNGIKLERK